MKIKPAPMPVAPSYSTLSGAELLAKVVCQYRVDRPKTCVFWTRGVNDTYQVKCAGERYSLRVYRHALRNKDDIEFEIAALNYLRMQGADIAYPIEKKDGGYITEIQAPEGLRYIVLTSHAEGEQLKYDKPDDSRRFGESAATLHKLAEGFATTFRRKNLDLGNLLDSPLDTLRPYLIDRSEDLAFVVEIAKDARSAVRARPIENFDSGFCHGDLHGGNAHQADGVLTHYDFDCCGFGLRIFELATFNWDAKLVGRSEERWPYFIEGYRSVRDFNDSELELLNTFVLIRHFWWIGSNLENVGGFEHEMASEDSIDYYLHSLKKFVNGDVGKLSMD